MFLHMPPDDVICLYNRTKGRALCLGKSIWAESVPKSNSNMNTLRNKPRSIHYRKRAKEVAARTVMKHHKEEGHKKGK